MYTFFFFFNDTATTEIYTLSLHDALPIYRSAGRGGVLLRERRQLPRGDRGAPGDAAAALHPRPEDRVRLGGALRGGRVHSRRPARLGPGPAHGAVQRLRVSLFRDHAGVRARCAAPRRGGPRPDDDGGRDRGGLPPARGGGARPPRPHRRGAPRGGRPLLA